MVISLLVDVFVLFEVVLAEEQGLSYVQTICSEQLSWGERKREKERGGSSSSQTYICRYTADTNTLENRQ